MWMWFLVAAGYLVPGVVFGAALGPAGRSMTRWGASSADMA